MDPVDNGRTRFMLKYSTAMGWACALLECILFIMLCLWEYKYQHGEPVNMEPIYWLVGIIFFLRLYTMIQECLKEGVACDHEGIHFGGMDDQQGMGC